MARSVSNASSHPERLAPPAPEMLRAQLREAFRMAVDGEHRFGLREDARPELEKRWDRVIDLTLQLCPKAKK